MAGASWPGTVADPGFEFPTQTLSLVPHACTSYVATVGDALIANMLAGAPEAVDARYRPDADLNLCLVLAGGGDFFKGADPAQRL